LFLAAAVVVVRFLPLAPVEVEKAVLLCARAVVLQGVGLSAP
jgi:hypothetical protein